MQFTCEHEHVLGTVPADLIGTEEGARLCAEIDRKASDLRRERSSPAAEVRESRKPKRGKVKLPRKAAA